MDVTLVKRHPYVTGAVAVFVILILYLVLKRGRATSGGGVSADTALTNIATASSLQSAQINAGIEIAQIQGQVATNQVNAQLAAAQGAQKTAVDLATISASKDLGLANIAATESTNVATINANAATDIATVQANTVLGIAGYQADVAKTQIASLNDVAKTLGTQKQLGSKVTNLIAALQGPQAIQANQPAAVATVNAGVAGGPVGILQALNPAKLLSAFFGG